jgi:acetyl esterase/lipase
MIKKYILLLACAVYLTAAAYNVTTYTFKTVGDVKIELDVYTPPTAAPAGGYPVFFAIHGGGYVGGSKNGAFSAQEYEEVMKRGWALVSIDYRLLPGVFLDDIVEDIQDAHAWVRSELVKYTTINPDLVTVFGQSAGGGLAAVSGYKLSPRPKVVLGFYSGRPNWTDPFAYNPATPVDPLVAAAANKLSVPVLSEYNSSGSADPRSGLYAAAQVNRKMGWMAVTHDPNFPTDKIMEKLRTLSASENVDKDYPATYLGHGLADTTVPYSQSVMLANSLEKNGIPHILDLVPGANHGFDYDTTLWEQHVLPAFDFAEKYMKPSGKVSMKFLRKNYRIQH